MNLNPASEIGNTETTNLLLNNPGTDQFTSSTNHRVYMSFVFGKIWRCRFHEGNLAKAPISRVFVFRDKEKIYEAARRGGLSSSDAHYALNEAISAGCGGIWLQLNDAQYSSLRLPKNRAAA
jgi:hypothetical protein